MKLRAAVIAIFASFLVFSCARPSLNAIAGQDSATAPAAVAQQNAAPTVDSAVDGKQLYTANCASCHKDDGTGGKKVVRGTTINPSNLTSSKIRKFSDERIAEAIKNGVEDEMPAFKDRLNDEQVAAIVKYVRTELQKQ